MSAPELPGWEHRYSGKVRDIYVPSDPTAGDVVLIVASDRISAYDFALEPPIPDKGTVLTRLSLWWFEQLADIVPGHVVSTDVPDAVAGRAMICTALDMFPIECVARGYLTGSGLADYRATGEVCGVALPPGLEESARLDPPIFTPASKAAQGDHDENITFAQVSRAIGEEDALALRELTLAVYARAEEIARERGVIVADTKLEFGRDAHGTIVLGDEVLTPDSSRFWDAAGWAPGQPQPSFDKQFVRDWLTQESGWDRSGETPPPPLPEEVVARTRQRYIDAFERITGTTF